MNETLTAVLTHPSCETLCALQADLLQAGHAPDTPALRVLEQFFTFLNELSASMSAREFSHLATLLDIGAVGGVAVQNLLESDGAANLWRRLLMGGISEGLMVLASRQYVKSAEAGIVSVYRQAGWTIYRELWQLSVQLQPEQDPAQRRQMLDTLLAPVHDDAIPGAVKAALLGRLFQLLLLVNLRLTTDD